MGDTADTAPFWTDSQEIIKHIYEACSVPTFPLGCHGELFHLSQSRRRIRQKSSNDSTYGIIFAAIFLKRKGIGASSRLRGCWVITRGARISVSCMWETLCSADRYQRVIFKLHSSDYWNDNKVQTNADPSA